MAEQHFKIIRDLIDSHQLELDELSLKKDQLLEDLSFYEQERFLIREQQEKIEEEKAIFKIDNVTIGDLEKFLSWHETNGDNFKNNYFIESLIKSKDNGESIYGSTAISFINLLEESIDKGFELNKRLDEGLEDFIKKQTSNNTNQNFLIKPDIRDENQLNGELAFVRSKIRKNQSEIEKLTSLLSFAKSIDSEKILAFTDGYLDMKEAEKFNLILEYDGELREKIEIQKKFNSYSLSLKNHYEGPDASILENWLEIEENSKKNEEILAEFISKDRSLFSKIKDFITFRPLDLSFAAITPLFIGAGLLYGTNSTIVASNPAIIQLSSLSSDSEIYLESVENTFPGSNAMISRGENNLVASQRKVLNFKDCTLPKLKSDPKAFNKQFHIMVTNPKTKKTFKFSDNDKLLSGNKIKFYFDYNDKGTIYIDNVLPSNEGLRIQETEEDTPCKTENFLIADYKANTRSKIGETYSINPPWRRERIIIFFKDEKSEEKYPIGLLNYQPTTLEIFDKKFMNMEWEKKKNVQELERNGLYKLYSNVFKKTLYAPNIKSWKNIDEDKNDINNIFIDFDGDNKAEIIAIRNEEKNVEYYVFDTNEDSIGDILVYPKIEENFISYEWLIDTNYDGFIDQMGYDEDGDWKTEKTKDM